MGSSGRTLSPDEAARLPYRPGVGIMLIDAQGRIFAGQRADSDGPAWQTPQGGIDEGETPRDAALRELEEEIGLPPGLVEVVAEAPDWLTYDLPPDLVGRVWGGRWRGQRQRWFLMRLTGSDADIRLDVPHPEFSAWRWMTADELLAAVVPFKRGVYEQAVAAFRAHLA
jgi:putative (di)nucleoside polyphosphate hydrolase